MLASLQSDPARSPILVDKKKYSAEERADEKSNPGGQKKYSAEDARMKKYYGAIWNTCEELAPKLLSNIDADDDNKKLRQQKKKNSMKRTPSKIKTRTPTKTGRLSKKKDPQEEKTAMTEYSKSGHKKTHTAGSVSTESIGPIIKEERSPRRENSNDGILQERPQEDTYSRIGIDETESIGPIIKEERSPRRENSNDGILQERTEENKYSRIGIDRLDRGRLSSRKQNPTETVAERHAARTAERTRRLQEQAKTENDNNNNERNNNSNGGQHGRPKCSICGGKHRDVMCWEDDRNAHQRPPNWKPKKKSDMQGAVIDFDFCL
eukprot:jgi/Psemu1/12271/gm1.12271_g